MATLPFTCSPRLPHARQFPFALCTVLQPPIRFATGRPSDADKNCMRMYLMAVALRHGIHTEHVTSWVSAALRKLFLLGIVSVSGVLADLPLLNDFLEARKQPPFPHLTIVILGAVGVSFVLDPVATLVHSAHEEFSRRPATDPAVVYEAANPGSLAEAIDFCVSSFGPIFTDPLPP